MPLKFFLRCLLLGLVLFVARYTSAAPVLSSNRWLIVVDSSFSMNNRAAASGESVQALIYSHMNGQLRAGDTIGMWSFNETLYTGHFPLEVWHPAVSQSIAGHAAQFLATQRYEKTTHYDRVMPALERLVTNSDILTIIFLTDGDANIKGTPFDAPINAAFKKDFRFQKKARAPFIVALRSEGGKIVDFTVTLAPWIATFPALPPQPVPEPEALVAPAPKPVVPSLILTGTKNANTNLPVPFTPVTQSQPAITLAPEPVATLIPEPATNAPVTPGTQTNVPAAIETPNVEAAPTPVQPTESVPANSTPPPEKLMNETAPVIPETPPSPVVKSTRPGLELPIEEPTKPLVSEPVQPLAEHATTTAVVVTEENAPPAVVTTQTVATATSPLTTVPAKPTPVQTGTVTLPETNSGNQSRLLLGIGLVVVALGIGVFWMRKPRPATGGSLITRSIDKDKKDS